MYKTAAWLVRLLVFFLPWAFHAAANDHRVVIYYQTTNLNGSASNHVSLLPLIENEPISVTHVIVGAVHLQDGGSIHLNDYPPDNVLFDEVWSDVAQLQTKGVIVTAMLGGAAQGSFTRLDGDQANFEKYYGPLHDFIGTYNMQGLDLDVEENMSLEGVIRLIDRLKADFGNDFVITLAPVASALQKGGGNLSGFSYFELEAQRGGSIDFYNAQFYFGWGTASSTSDYENIVHSGFVPEKVTMIVLSNSENGSGFVQLNSFANVLKGLVSEYLTFGGVAAWEYFNSLPGGTSGPAEWAIFMANQLAFSSSKNTSSSNFSRKQSFHDARHVVRRWKRELWQLLK